MTDDPNAAVRQARVAALEGRYGLRLPEDFRLHLLDPAADQGWTDNRGIEWWATHRIRNVPDECGATPEDQVHPEIEKELDHYLIFADFLCWCYAWAICCSEGRNRGKVARVGSGGDLFVADSFSDFVALARNDTLAIHVGA